MTSLTVPVGRKQGLPGLKILTNPGTCDTLLCHLPATAHFTVLNGVREKQRITDGLVRMSEGIENTEDIVSDPEKAL